MINELKTIFENLDADIFTPENMQSVATLFEKEVDKRVNDRVQLEVENAIKEQYEKFKIVSDKALKRIDEDQTNKLKTLVEHINKSHTAKLLLVKEKYEKLISENAKNHLGSLVKSIDEFTDMYLEKNLPTEMIAEAAKNQYALKQIDEARRVLGVDDRFIKNNLKEGILDGKNKMDQLIKENKELKKNQIVKETKDFLTIKTANLPTQMGNFVRNSLRGKSLEFIKENLNYTIDMYKRNQKSEKRNTLLREQHTHTISNVDRNRVADELINENTTNSTSHDPMDAYLEGLKFKK